MNLTYFFENLSEKKIVIDQSSSFRNFLRILQNKNIIISSKAPMRFNATLKYNNSYEFLTLLNELRKSKVFDYFSLVFGGDFHTLRKFMKTEPKHKFQILSYNLDTLFFFTLKNDKNCHFQTSKSQVAYIPKEKKEYGESITDLLKGFLPKPYRIRKMDGEEGLLLRAKPSKQEDRIEITISNLNKKRLTALDLLKSKDKITTIEKTYLKYRYPTPLFNMVLKQNTLNKILGDIDEDSPLELSIRKTHTIFKQPDAFCFVEPQMVERYEFKKILEISPSPKSLLFIKSFKKILNKDSNINLSITNDALIMLIDLRWAEILLILKNDER